MSLLRQIHSAMEEEDTVDSGFAIPPVTDKHELVGRIAESVAADDWRTLQAYILEQRLPDQDQCWELTAMMAPCLSTDNLQDKPQFFTTVRRCLTYFSRHGRPKEMVLAFLEQLEGFHHDDACLITLMPCLQNVLLQLPVKRGRSLELTLDTLGNHIKAIPAPRNWNLEGEEFKLLETDETVSRFLNVVPAFLDFMQPFLEGGGGSSQEDSSGRLWEVKILKKHLLQLFRHPLAFLDLRFSAKEPSPKTYSREIAENVVRCLTVVEKNFYRLLIQNPSEGVTTFRDAPKTKENSPSCADDVVEDADMEEENRENERRALEGGEGEESEESNGEEEDFSMTSAACLLYLTEVEGQGQQCWPAVMSVEHLLHSSLPYARLLLANPAHTAVYKGLSLLSFHLDCIPAFSLDTGFLDDGNVMLVINTLISLMLRCPIRELRLSALSVFRAFFPCLACAGRYQLMKSVLASCEHAGVKAVVVSLLKKEIDTALSQNDQNAVENSASVPELVGDAQSKDSVAAHGTNSPVRESVGDAQSKDSVAAHGTNSPVRESVGDAQSKDRMRVASSKETELPKYFFNEKLKELLILATTLPDGPATDLLDQSDLIMATLNLLRYLVLRDCRRSNQTGVWDMWSWLEKDYLSKLCTGLDMSVGHYQLELNNLTRNRGHSSGSKRGDLDIEAAVSVGGMELPPMTHEQRVSVLSSALTTFDLIRCVLARLSELADHKGKAAL
ncbi:hypothetical protein ACOMHN_064107 [Nucella lapillus]